MVAIDLEHLHLMKKVAPPVETQMYTRVLRNGINHKRKNIRGILMSYFSNFPVIPYDSEGNGNLKDVTNLLRRVVVRTKIEENTSVFDTYDVKEGETPEMIAHKLYGDINLHWVVLLFNKVKDRYD